MDRHNTTILADPEALAQFVAEWLTGRALHSAGRFTLCLSGGSTPKRLFEILAGDAYRERFPWERTHLFWGDERFVPHDDKDSNYRMTREALLDHVPVPPAHVHAMPVGGTPAEAALAYEQELRVYYGEETLESTRPLFDVTLLGLGENGHTASLFPGTSALQESLHWVAPVTEGVPQPRLTLTYPTLASSAVVAFLVAGKSKYDVLQRVWNGDRTQPAARITADGELHWFVDKFAVEGRG